MKNKKMLIIISIIMIILAFTTIIVIIKLPQKSINVGEKLVQKNTNAVDIKTENNIFAEVSMNEGMTDKDLSLPENLLDNNYTSIIKVKVLSVGEEAVFLPKKEKFYNPYTPYIPVNIQILENISGDQLSGNVTIYMKGGKVKITDVEKQVDIEEQEKMGIMSLTQEEKETKYINYKIENEVELNKNEEYIFLLAKQATNLYTLNSNGYAVFKEEQSDIQTRSNNTIRTFKNVLTQKELTYTKSGETY